MNDGKLNTPARKATLYRMVMHDHVCPFGLKSKALLEREGCEVDNRWLTTRQETDAFQAKHDVETTPQILIGGEQIGAYEELRAFFGKSVPDPDATSYRPIVAIFLTALLLGLAISRMANGTLLSPRTAEWFVATAMCLLGLQKLKDLESFSNMFLNYDLLAQRKVRYAYVYPFAETLAGVLMVAGAMIWLAAPLALFIGGIGAV